jgi:hypothetical protein
MTIFHEFGLGVNLNVVQQKNRIMLRETAMNKLNPSGMHDVVCIKEGYYIRIQVCRSTIPILRGVLSLLACENLKWKPILCRDVGDVFRNRRRTTHDNSVG